MGEHMNLRKNLYQVARYAVWGISFILIACLFLCSLFVSYYAEDMDSQVALPHFDPVLFHIIGSVLILFIFRIIARQSDKHIRTIKKVLLPAVLLYFLAAGFLLALLGRSAPSADPYSIYALGQSFAKGDLSAIQPTADTYLSFYPHQIGLTAFYELIFRLWNLLPIRLEAYHFLKCLNIFFALGIVYFQYKTVHLLWNSDRVDILYLLFALGNQPLLFYTSFVYGEIPSFACVTLGIYLFLSVTWQHAWDSLKPSARFAHLGGSLLAFTAGVCLRKNSLIIIIAVILPVLFYWLYTKRHELLLYAILLALFAGGILPLTQSIYEKRAGNTLLPGVPAISYFAMGMQEASRGNGWYNGFNFYTYLDSGMDTGATAILSREAIQDRLETFSQNPGYAFAFYRDKLLSQWTDGSFACRQATLATFGGRNQSIEAVYTNGTFIAKLFSDYCNLYLTVLYLGVLSFLILERKYSGKHLLVYIGLIGVLGGFLFHLIWEANSRYILPYGLMLLPYAAMGMYRCLEAFATLKTKKSKSQK